MVHHHEWIPEHIEPWGVSNKFIVHGKCRLCRVKGVIIIDQDDIEWDYMEWYSGWHLDGHKGMYDRDND